MPRVGRLSRAFFARHTEVVARDLLGKVLVCGGWYGRLVETEAYHGPDDRASHGHRGETPRNKIMFGPAGFAYVYLIYGMHNCLNVTTAEVGVAAAVLLRAAARIPGRPWPEVDAARGGAGPAKLAAAFGIDRRMYGEDMVLGKTIWIGDDGAEVGRIAAGPRIGVDYAGESASTPWRFWVADHPSVSKLPRRKT